jgi:hypothetical protein
MRGRVKWTWNSLPRSLISAYRSTVVDIAVVKGESCRWGGQSAISVRPEERQVRCKKCKNLWNDLRSIERQASVERSLLAGTQNGVWLSSLCCKKKKGWRAKEFRGGCVYLSSRQKAAGQRFLHLKFLWSNQERSTMRWSLSFGFIFTHILYTRGQASLTALDLWELLNQDSLNPSGWVWK